MSLMTPTMVELDGALTVASAGERREQLLAALADAGDELALNLAGIDAFDSAGVQLLLATHRTLAQRGATLALHNLPAVVTEALSVLGLEGLFRLRVGA